MRVSVVVAVVVVGTVVVERRKSVIGEGSVGLGMTPPPPPDGAGVEYGVGVVSGTVPMSTKGEKLVVIQFTTRVLAITVQETGLHMLPFQR